MLLRVFTVITLCATLAWTCSMSFFKAPFQKDRRSETALFRFEKHGKAGFINAKGIVVIPPKFDVGWFSEEDFVEGLAPARDGENWGYIDREGNWAIPPRFWRVQAFSEGRAAVTLLDKRGLPITNYVDANGIAVIENVQSLDAGPFSGGLAAVRSMSSKVDANVGYIDSSGTAVIPYQFANGGPFQDGLAAVVFPGHCGVAERSTIVDPAAGCGEPGPDAKSCGAGFIDQTGRVVFRFEDVRDFSEGLAAVKKGGKWGFIDPLGKFEIDAAFESALSFNEGLAAAEVNGKWGYINPAGRWVIPAQFKTADGFSDGLALTDQGYIDSTGNLAIRRSSGTAFVQGLAHVDLGHGDFGYIDHAGKVVFRYHPDAVAPRMLPYSKNPL